MILVIMLMARVGGLKNIGWGPDFVSGGRMRLLRICSIEGESGQILVVEG